MDNMEAQIPEKLRRIKVHLSFLENSSLDSVLHYKDKEGLNFVEISCLGFLQRLHHVTSSSILLFDQLQNAVEFDQPKLLTHEFSIGILFRSIILDYMICQYIWLKMSDWVGDEYTESEKKQKIFDVCKHALSDGLMQYVDLLYDECSMSIITEDERDRQIKNLLSGDFANFINYQTGSKPTPRYNRFPQGKAIFHTFGKSDKTKIIASFYRVYSILSKYDHFGALYFSTLKMPLEEKVIMYYNSCEMFAFHISSVYGLLKLFLSNDEFIIEKDEEASTYFREKF